MYVKGPTGLLICRPRLTPGRCRWTFLRMSMSRMMGPMMSMNEDTCLPFLMPLDHLHTLTWLYQPFCRYLFRFYLHRGYVLGLDGTRGRAWWLILRHVWTTTGYDRVHARITMPYRALPQISGGRPSHHDFLTNASASCTCTWLCSCACKSGFHNGEPTEFTGVKSLTLSPSPAAPDLPGFTSPEPKPSSPTSRPARKGQWGPSLAFPPGFSVPFFYLYRNIENNVLFKCGRGTLSCFILLFSFFYLLLFSICCFQFRLSVVSIHVMSSLYVLFFSCLLILPFHDP